MKKQKIGVKIFMEMGLQAMVVNKNYMKKKKFFSELAKGLLPHVKEFLTHIKAIPPTRISCYDM